MHPNIKAFLDMIAYSEIGPTLLALSDDGYNVLVGSSPLAMKLFESYADHPRTLQFLQNFRNPKTGKMGLFSSAAGRYQILRKTFDVLKARGIADDFSPESQDACAVELIRGRGALHAVEAGFFADAVKLCRKEWASLPGAGYGQHENKMELLRTVYQEAGGKVA